MPNRLALLIVVSMMACLISVSKASFSRSCNMHGECLFGPGNANGYFDCVKKRCSCTNNVDRRGEWVWPGVVSRVRPPGTIPELEEVPFVQMVGKKCTVGYNGACGAENGLEVFCQNGLQCIQQRCSGGRTNGQTCVRQSDCVKPLRCHQPDPEGSDYTPPGLCLPDEPTFKEPPTFHRQCDINGHCMFERDDGFLFLDCVHKKCNCSNNVDRNGMWEWPGVLTRVFPPGSTPNPDPIPDMHFVGFHCFTGYAGACGNDRGLEISCAAGLQCLNHRCSGGRKKSESCRRDEDCIVPLRCHFPDPDAPDFNFAGQCQQGQPKFVWPKEQIRIA